MDIAKLIPLVEKVHNDPSYIVTLESHLTHLRKSPDLKMVNITSLQQGKFEGDFYGLLQDLGYATAYHYAILRINGYDSPTDYAGDPISILIPSQSDLDMLKNTHMTRAAW